LTKHGKPAAQVIASKKNEAGSHRYCELINQNTIQVNTPCIDNLAIVLRVRLGNGKETRHLEI